MRPVAHCRPFLTLCQIFVLAAFGGGCDFFQELESEPGAGESGAEESTGADEGTGDTDDGPCTLAEDDRCLDQDTVQSCSVEDGTVSELDCGALCGGFTNFSCVATGTGQHACWCVEPGPTKVYTCRELEDCMEGCPPAADFSCPDQCFARTDAMTIRIFGALLHCAEATCEQQCIDAPQTCNACIEAARIEGSGGCSLPRAICDDDRNPEDPWP